MAPYAISTAICLGLLFSTAMAQTPKRLAAPPADDYIAPAATISNEAYVAKESLPPPPPQCQLKIGTEWAAEPTKTLEACAALLDQKTPAQPKDMTTAYWNGMHLAADAKTIYQADAKSDWSVLRPRSAR